jgi:glutaredoxin
VDLDFYVFDSCGGCNIQNPCKPCTLFIKLDTDLRRLLDKSGFRRKVNLSSYNIYFENDRNQCRENLARFGMTEPPALPAVVIGDRILTGTKNMEEGVIPALKEEFAFPGIIFKALGAERRGRYTTGLYEKTTAVMFSLPTCEDCKKTAALLEDTEGLSVVTHETLTAEGRKLYERYCGAYGVPVEDYAVPRIFMGRDVFLGYDETLVRLEDTLKKGERTLRIEGKTGTEKPRNGNGVPPGDSRPGGNAVYFYITGCTSCAKAEQALDRLQPGETVSLARYNIIEEDSNALFLAYCDFFRVPGGERITPMLFAGDRYFAGAEAIEKEFTAFAGMGPFETVVLETETGGLAARFGGFRLVGAFVTGFLNGINPCSLSILILLAALLAARQFNLFKLGTLFCLGKALAYFAIGTVFYSVFSGMEMQQYRLVYRLSMTVICLFFMLFNVWDLIAAIREDYGRIRLQLPARLKGLNFSLIKKMAAVQSQSLLGVICFFCGVITSVGEFFCTGQIYIAAILSMIHGEEGLQARALLFLGVYSVAFVLPFFIVTVALHKGTESFDVSDFIRRRLPLIKGANIVIFLAILIWVWLS